MTEIKKIYKKDVPALLADTALWTHSFMAITKHRLYAHYNNPLLEEDDIVLLLAYLNNELVGYMGLFIDNILIDNKVEKIGWLSTWWVHPKTKGTGIGREILNTMYTANNGKIGISQFTPSAKRVYDKSGYFTTLKESVGLKAVLRSNLRFVIPAIFPKTKNLLAVFEKIDHLLNFFVNIKLSIQKAAVTKALKNITLDYIHGIDDDTLNIIKSYNKNDLSPKGKSFFDWLQAYHWVQKAPLLHLTNKHRYAFSSYDKEFEFSLIKVLKENTCVGFVVLQKRGFVTKVLFAYYDKTRFTRDISNIIILQALAQNTREIICYDTDICNEFRKSNLFLYKTKKVKHSIISKAFNTTDFAGTRMHFGDGDCSFA